ncbi:hypothetical protein [Sphingobacterium multivorum]|uniref:hypothetical protein n=1 Tax=Sphingobacterium multivorum TaxID=28454 RepID=UPI0028B25679|nr:hypothetical protein [Sphingobacterium multivorum]
MEAQQINDLHRLMWLANVRQFFADKPAAQLWSNYTTWLKNREGFQQLYSQFSLNELTDLDFRDIERLSHGAVLITFHYGPYRLLPKILLRLGYKLTLLASAEILKREADYYGEELQGAGIHADHFESIDANNASALKRILSAVSNGRLVIVFLDANEGQRHDYDQRGRLAVPFSDHFFYWRTNILKLAARFKIPLYSTYMVQQNTGLQWSVHPFVPVMLNGSHAREERLMQAFSILQQTFQQMMNQGWIYWENWAFIHLYNGHLAVGNKGIKAQGSWMVPLLYQQKKYLFDINNRQFFRVTD